MKVNNLVDGASQIKESLSDETSLKIVNIIGKFLTGKTTIIENLISDTEFINQYNVYTYVNDWAKYNYLFDITSEFFENSNLQYPEFISEESKYFVKSFFDSISTLNISNKDLFKEINQYLLIENETELNSELNNRIKKEISSELKRNLFLNYYEISIECLLTDLINNFFPLNSEIDSLSKYLITKNPIKILLIFDDAQSVPPKIDKWFEELYNYLTNRTLGDLKLYDYQGEDAQIKFGEFFEIDLIFISRNMPLNLKNQKLTNTIIEIVYDNIANESINNQSLIFQIPALNTIFNNFEEDKETSILIYATNHLLKYIPQDFKKAVIFASIFKTFNIIDLNLFDEAELTEKEFEILIQKADFIFRDKSQFLFDEDIKKLLNDVFYLVFENKNLTTFTKISEDINETFPNIKYFEFEILRELAYFKNFDKNYVIDNYFKKPKEIYSFLESNIHYFDREKSFYSIKDIYLIPLRKYNSLRDAKIISDKKNSIEELFYNYQKEIENRNNILQNDVITVGNEISDFQKEKSNMESQSDSLSKNEIVLKNELFEIEQKLKPFIHHNSKRKSTINIIALIISVAIIFNSDSVSLYLFNTSSDYDIIILITITSLILLYGNGLMRYFRVKFQSEELYSLKQNQNKIESSILNIEKELEELNADIRAKESKIEDLKKHIERMNIQIFENKQKLEKKFID